MNILFVVGGCLQQNSSANLCHAAYIRGAVENDHLVDVISLNSRDVLVDPDIQLPQVHEWFTYDGALYTHIAKRKKGETVVSQPSNGQQKKSSSWRNRIFRKLKDLIIASYGVYGLEKAWVHHAEKFYSSREYDLVISLATPPASHLLVKRLIKRNRLHTKYWCQVWEDPWASELYIDDKFDKKQKEEGKIVSCADKVLYVSPLTLMYQKKLHPESANKMDWCPLPFYYQNVSKSSCGHGDPLYGYYGDYDPRIRNLEPLYKAVKKTGVRTNIFGNPADLFASTDKVCIKPRVGLKELHEAEKETDVLLFLSNLRGGQIPGKIYQYSATNKKIIFILDGTAEEKQILKKYFAQFHRYVFCDNTVESIVEAINRSKQPEMIADITTDAIDAFSPKNTLKNIIKKCRY